MPLAQSRHSPLITKALVSDERLGSPTMFALPGFEGHAQGPRILVAGDIVVSQNGCERLSSESVDVWGDLAHWVAAHDLFIVTLDGTFPGDDPKPTEPRVVNGAPVVDSIPAARQTVVNLANNHAFDMGLAGFHALRAALRARNFEVVGAGVDRQEAERPWIGTIGAAAVRIFAVVHPGCHPRSPLGDGAQVASLDSASWWSAVEATSQQSEFTIVLVHGGVQGCHFPSPEAIRVSRRLASLGVGAVVWSHAHTVQGIENHMGCFIAYGLGNVFFCPLRGDPAEPSFPGDYDEGLLVSFSPAVGSPRPQGIFVRRTGLRLQAVSPSVRGANYLEGLSATLSRRAYTWRWRILRISEDVVLGTLRYFTRHNFWTQLYGLRPRHLVLLMKKIGNARTDAKDV